MKKFLGALYLLLAMGAVQPSFAASWADVCDFSDLREIWIEIARAIQKIDAKLLEALVAEFPDLSMEARMEKLAELIKDPAKWNAFRARYGISDCTGEVKATCRIMGAVKPALPPWSPGGSLENKCSWIKRCFASKKGGLALIAGALFTAYEAMACKPDGNEAAKALKDQWLKNYKDCNKPCSGTNAPSPSPSPTYVPYKQAQVEVASTKRVARATSTPTPLACDECDAMGDAMADALSKWFDDLLASTNCAACEKATATEVFCEPVFDEPSDPQCSSAVQPTSNKVPAKSNLRKSNTQVKPISK